MTIRRRTLPVSLAFSLAVVLAAVPGRAQSPGQGVLGLVHGTNTLVRFNPTHLWPLSERKLP